MLDDIDTVTVVTGKASFVDRRPSSHRRRRPPHNPRGQTSSSKTGAQPVIPEIPGLRDSRYTATSAEMLRTTTLPGRLAVLGGGYLGLEFAAMYRQFGSEVTVLESAPPSWTGRTRTSPRRPCTFSAKQGITLLPGSLVTEIRDEPAARPSTT